ncbi:hypothetical protein [Lysinibacillus sp. NPDC086135]|uniref:hypothetical protein n=1 Tax=Lysinibacillus sp. NPDC086135 TaxID=3364130 RepID=UPI0037F9B7B2
MNHIEVKEFTSQEDHDEYINRLNEQIKIIMHSVYQHCMNELPYYQQKKIFHDWWHGKSVYTDEYRKGIDEKLLYEVDSCILEACSRGFG